MKIKLQLKRTPDSAPEYYYTNLFVINRVGKTRAPQHPATIGITAVLRLLRVGCTRS
jgi:hypothetical protein